MSDSSIDAASEISDLLDALVLMAKLDHAPVRAISLLEEARTQLQSHLDQIDLAGMTTNRPTGLPS